MIEGVTQMLLPRSAVSARCAYRPGNEHLRGRRDHSSQMWQLLVFELWHRNFLEVPRNGERLPVEVVPSARAALGEQQAKSSAALAPHPVG